MTQQANGGACRYRLAAIERLGREVRGLRLECADAAPLSFQSGQFVAVTTPGGLRRSYSMAAAPSDGGIELHVRLQPGGEFSEWLRCDARPGDALWLEGPYGDCVWRDDAGAAQTLMLATGTGIAPLRAMLQSGPDRVGRPPIALYWGGRTEDELYLFDELRAWGASGRTSVSSQCCPRPDRAGTAGAVSCSRRRPRIFPVCARRRYTPAARRRWSPRPGNC